MNQSPASTKPAFQIVPRPSKARGHADHGWLNSYHTFSFASYYDEEFERFHALRVINEDRVSGGNGFGKHSHREAEIFSYVVQGTLHHKDSMNNDEKLRRGDVQFTSAGTGIAHSEYNDSEKDMVHFIQIWVTPGTRNLKPGYQTKSFEDKEKLNKLLLTVGPEKSDRTVQINQDIKMYASILEHGKTVELPIKADREYYVHLIQDVKDFHTEYNEVAVKLSDQTVLQGGDGAFIRTPNQLPGGEKLLIENVSKNGRNAEFLLFDVAKNT